MWEITMLELIDWQTQVSLQQIIMNIPDPCNPKCKLFHAVNKMFICNGYIFHFHPSRSQQAREMVAYRLTPHGLESKDHHKDTTCHNEDDPTFLLSNFALVFDCLMNFHIALLNIVACLLDVKINLVQQFSLMFY